MYELGSLKFLRQTVGQLEADPDLAFVQTVKEAQVPAGDPFCNFDAQFYRSQSTGRHGPPDDPNALYWFMKALSNRYAGKVGAYEIWNEQNLSGKWGTGKLDAGTRAGLKKYQQAEGLKITGTLNKVTLEKMGIVLTDQQKRM